MTVASSWSLHWINYTLRLIQHMTGCKRIRYYIPPVHEKLAKVTIRNFCMVRETSTTYSISFMFYLQARLKGSEHSLHLLSSFDVVDGVCTML